MEKSPPLVVIVREEAVDEAKTADYGSKEQHLGVETQPRKINTDLLPVVLPVEKNQSGSGKLVCCRSSFEPTSSELRLRRSCRT